MTKDEVREEVQRLWCQHCKALQKTNETVVECWYNPLDDEEKAFCAANEDAVDAFLSRVLIPADDQIPPENPYIDRASIYSRAQQDMIRGDKETKWVKVVK